MCMVGLVVPRMKVLELGSTIPLGGLVFRKPACQADFRGLNYANLHYGIEGCNV